MDKSKLAAKTYDKIAAIYTTQYFEDLSETFYIDKFLSKLPNKAKILDVGCGPGQFTKYVLEKGFLVEGVDYSKSMVKIAREKVPGGVFQHMDMRKMDYKNSSFDGLLVAYSLIHIPSSELSKTLKEFRRIMKPKSYMLVIVQKGEPDRIVDEPLKRGERMFINFFTRKGLVKLISKSGFKVVYSKVVDTKDPESLSDRVIYIIAKNSKTN